MQSDRTSIKEEKSASIILETVTAELKSFYVFFIKAGARLKLIMQGNESMSKKTQTFLKDVFDYDVSEEFCAEHFAKGLTLEKVHEVFQELLKIANDKNLSDTVKVAFLAKFMESKIKSNKLSNSILAHVFEELMEHFKLLRKQIYAEKFSWLERFDATIVAEKEEVALVYSQHFKQLFALLKKNEEEVQENKKFSTEFKESIKNNTRTLTDSLKTLKEKVDMDTSSIKWAVHFDPNANKLSGTYIRIVELFFKHHLEFSEAIKNVKNIQEQVTEEENKLKTQAMQVHLQKEYIKLKNKFDLTDVKNQFETLKQKLAMKCDALENISLTTVKVVLASLKQRLDQLEKMIQKLELPTDCPKEIGSVTDLNKKFNDCARYVKEIKNKLDAFDNELSTEELHIQRQIKEENVKHATVRQIEQEKNKQEVMDYKSTLGDEKQKREEQKSKERDAAIQQKNQNDNNNNVQEVKLLNVAMEDKLKKINKNNLTTLRGIVDPKSKEKIYYEDVVRLVEYFGGKVSKKGGGSHRTIEIAKLVVSFMVNDDVKNVKEKGAKNKKNKAKPNDKKSELEVKHTDATGGFQDPHEPGRSSGLLTPFNLSMVREVFTKAGIGLQEVVALENEKENITSESATPSPKV